MEANNTLLQMKYAHVISLFAAEMGVSTERALDTFYHSKTYQDLRDGIADLHCRSDRYIVDELKLELQGYPNCHRC